jgi:hypothetical protein
MQENDDLDEKQTPLTVSRYPGHDSGEQRVGLFKAGAE